MALLFKPVWDVLQVSSCAHTNLVPVHQEEGPLDISQPHPNLTPAPMPTPIPIHNLHYPSVLVG